MRALQCTELDGPGALEVRDVEPPGHDGAVLIDVAAAGVAFPDLLLTRGEYQLRLEPPFTPGVEVTGRVAAAPDGAGVALGERVMAFTTAGGWAEQVAVDPANVLPVPEGLDEHQAAGFLMNHHTAHFALHRRGRLAAGETVLVHGAAGGVGTCAVQIARGGGARVIAVGSTERKRQVALDAGADEAIGADEGWRDQVRELTDGRGVDVVVDPVGGDRFTDSLRSLAPEGRLLVIGFTGGSIPTVKVNRLLLNNIAVVGVGWGAFLPHDPGLTTTIQDDLDRLVADGVVDPVVGAVHDLADGAQALRVLDEREAIGKVVLQVRA